MKIALGEKVNYYDVCPYCGTERGNGRENCEKCGKSLIRTVEKNKEASEEDPEEISLYKVRAERTASETFNSLKGKDKVRYFADYYLGKIIVIVIIAAILGSIVYTALKPKPVPILYVALVVSPFTAAGQEQFKNDLTDLFVKNEKDEEIFFDSNYVSLVADYNSMMTYTMKMTANEIDIVILTKDELKYQVNNKVLLPVSKAISKDILDKIDDSVKYRVTPAYLQDNGDVEYGEEDVYGLNLENFLKNINGFETSNKYCVAFTSIAQNRDKFDDVVKYMFDIE